MNIISSFVRGYNLGSDVFYDVYLGRRSHATVMAWRLLPRGTIQIGAMLSESTFN